ncbi:MAG: hypothetical protein ACREL7_18080 [Longimicrobiales bacterium]
MLAGMLWFAAILGGIHFAAILGGNRLAARPADGTPEADSGV